MKTTTSPELHSVIIDIIDVATRSISTLSAVSLLCTESKPIVICLSERLDDVKTALEDIYMLTKASAQHEESDGLARNLEKETDYISNLIRRIDKLVCQFEVDISPDPNLGSSVRLVLESESFTRYLRILDVHQRVLHYLAVALNIQPIQQQKRVMESTYTANLFSQLEKEHTLLDWNKNSQSSLKPYMESRLPGSDISLKRLDVHILRMHLRNILLGYKSKEPRNNFTWPHGHGSPSVLYGPFSEVRGSKRRSADIDQFLSELSRFMSPSTNVKVCIPVLGDGAGRFVNGISGISHNFVGLDKRTRYRRAVHNYIMLGMLDTLKRISSQDGLQPDPILNESLVALLEATENIDPVEDGEDGDRDLPPYVKDALLYCGSSPVMQTLFDKPMLQYCTDMSRILDRDYIPTEDDVVLLPPLSDPFHISHREISVDFDDVTLRLIELRSRSPGLVKWISILDRTAMFIFAVDLCSYDEKVTINNTNTTRLSLALELCDEVVDSNWMSSHELLVVLMDSSTLEDKLEKVPFKLYFPDFGGENERNAVCDYMTQRFEALSRNKSSVYVHHYVFLTENHGRMVLANLVNFIFGRGCTFGPCA